MSKEVKRVIIKKTESGQRLDRWLRSRFENLGQVHIEKMCRKGAVRIDGGRCKGSSRILAGQVVRIPPLPDQIFSAGFRKKKIINHQDAQFIRETVIYKDDQLIVLNKPAGIATQGGTKQTRHIDELSLALCFGFDEKPRLVHRLDKETSGILLLARNRLAAQRLTSSFRNKTTRKIYWAAVAGNPSPRAGTIKFGLRRGFSKSQKESSERMECVHPNEVHRIDGAKHAVTDYGVINYMAKRAAWVVMSPITGRTHQLRAHMAGIGHPIIGDFKYGRNNQGNLGDGWGVTLGDGVRKGLHLHARHLKFVHPYTGKEISFTAPLPGHMQETWRAFQWHLEKVPDDPFEQNFF